MTRLLMTHHFIHPPKRNVNFSLVPATRTHPFCCNSTCKHRALSVSVQTRPCIHPPLTIQRRNCPKVPWLRDEGEQALAAPSPRTRPLPDLSIPQFHLMTLPDPAGIPISTKPCPGRLELGHGNGPSKLGDEKWGREKFCAAHRGPRGTTPICSPAQHGPSMSPMYNDEWNRPWFDLRARFAGA